MRRKPTIFRQMKLDTEKRKKMKASIDSAISLNSSNANFIRLSAGSSISSETCRLLNEGAIMYSDGEVRLYIAKGTINKFVSQLSDSYVGYISIGHTDLRVFPLSLGYWTKKDLHIVDLDDGRQALDVDIHIDKELNIVKDLVSQDIALALSADLYPEFDWDMSDKLNVPIVKKFDIPGFSIVGSPANVDSNNVYLSEGENMTYEEFAEKFKKLNEEKRESVEELSEDEKKLNEIYEKVEKVVLENKSLKDQISGLKDENEQLRAEKSKETEKKEESKEDNKLSSADKLDQVLGLMESLSNGSLDKTDKKSKKSNVWGL